MLEIEISQRFSSQPHQERIELAAANSLSAAIQLSLLRRRNLVGFIELMFAFEGLFRSSARRMNEEEILSDL
ncbi:hypothetical protein ABUK73_10445 [Agrobacterium sp. BA1120]|uniref:hypothetical protein n=1 Tax=Agrobacterium sp. BA1120 TaxID=3228927 RepID=UPI00336AAAE4